MNSILKYPGAKNRIVSWICSYIPEHSVYLEPFGGSLAVLFNKPRCHIETVNDLNSDVVNFFKVLRDSPEALANALSLTPYSREEYDFACKGRKTDDNLEKARRFAVQCWMGFGSSNRYHNGFKSGQQTNSPNPAKGWSNLSSIIDIAKDRLAGVQIEHLPAVELIKRYNTPDVFIYADPPYLPEIRKQGIYKHEMSEQDHIELLEVLLEHPGKVMLSGYDNDLYNDMLQGWTKTTKETQAENGLKRTETLWMNYSAGVQIEFLFDENTNMEKGW